MIGKGSRKGGKSTKRESKKSGKSTKRGSKKSGRSTKRAARATGIGNKRTPSKNHSKRLRKTSGKGKGGQNEDDAEFHLGAVYQHQDIQDALLEDDDIKSESPVGKKFRHLLTLYEAGALDEVEFELRRAQLIDNMTGTYQGGVSSLSASSVSDSGSSASSCSTAGSSSVSTTTSSDPFSHVGSFRGKAMKAREIRYSGETQEWSLTDTVVQIDKKPFAKGAMRQAFRMRHPWSKADKWYVAKMYYDRKTGEINTRPKAAYFADVVMQAHASAWADAYNNNPLVPKHVTFLPAFLVQLDDGRIYACEPYVKGAYSKHNNNAGWVSDSMRNTPQAFSHYTYEASNHRQIVVDLQGVADYYTDPQIHSLDGDFGVGNKRAAGMDKFFSTHKCNAVCRLLGLPQRGAVPVDSIMGTRIRGQSTSTSSTSSSS